MARTLFLLGWNQTINQVINPLPLAVQAQRLFKGQISFGDVMQSASAFYSVHDSLSFFRSVYDSSPPTAPPSSVWTDWSTPTRRPAHFPRLDAGQSRDGSIDLRDVEVHDPHGKLLIDGLDLRLSPATRW